jgi:hypothetical protein
MKTNIVGRAVQRVPARVCRGEKTVQKGWNEDCVCAAFDCHDWSRLDRRWSSPFEGKREDGSGERAEGGESL